MIDCDWQLIIGLVSQLENEPFGVPMVSPS